MIKLETEYYSSPYYFFMKKKGNDYSLYVSAASTLTEAKDKEEMIKVPKGKLEKVKKYLENLLSKKSNKKTDEVKSEIEELVSSDGSMTNSRIPILDPRLHPRKTMDQRVAAARITNDPISRGYRTYYGESVEEIGEEDMSAAFGYEETKDLDGKETYKYFKEKLKMNPDEAKERTRQQGKDPYGKRDEKSPYRYKKVKTKSGKIVKKKDPNFISRQILPEIQKQKAIEMLEDMLAKRTDKSKGDINSKEKEVKVSNILKKNAKSLLKQMEKEGLSKKDFFKLLDNE